VFIYTKSNRAGEKTINIIKYQKVYQVGSSIYYLARGVPGRQV